MANSAICNSCDRRYHLSLRNDRAGQDCGAIWLDQEFLVLQFSCYLCLGKANAVQEPPLGHIH